MNKYPTIRECEINNIERLGYKFISCIVYDFESMILLILNIKSEMVKIRIKNNCFHDELKRLFKEV